MDKSQILDLMIGATKNELLLAQAKVTVIVSQKSSTPIGEIVTSGMMADLEIYLERALKWLEAAKETLK